MLLANPAADGRVVGEYTLGEQAGVGCDVEFPPVAWARLSRNPSTAVLI